MKDELNNQGIFLLDVYMLDYYGFKVFFQVCKTTQNSVFLIELETKRYRNGIMIDNKFKPSKNPYIILDNNLPTKSTYEVKPTKLNDYEYWLPIEIKVSSPLFLKALIKTDYPLYGTAYAVPIKDCLNKYWVDDKIEDKDTIYNLS